MTEPNQLRIIEDDLSSPEVASLLQTHLNQVGEDAPPESDHALDLDELKAPGISFFSAWADDQLLGFGGIKMLSDSFAEIKSMHTAEAARGRGVGGKILEHIIEFARDAGIERLSLETGTASHFAPARGLYERFGFTECEPFEPYVEDPYSVFMTINLNRVT